MKSKKKQDRKGGRGRPECIPLGSYFKALKDVFEANSYKRHLLAEIRNHSDSAEAHTSRINKVLEIISMLYIDFYIFIDLICCALN